MTTNDLQTRPAACGGAASSPTPEAEEHRARVDGADLPAVLLDLPLYDWQIRAIQQWRDAAVAASSPTWQPIETAPKDARVLAVLKPHPGQDAGEITFVYWWTGGCWTFDATGESCVPTHWMPLPAAPVRPETRPEPTDHKEQ